jgi:hypothetical protein
MKFDVICLEVISNTGVLYVNHRQPFSGGKWSNKQQQQQQQQQPLYTPL